jgi:hypothetical protein
MHIYLSPEHYEIAESNGIPAKLLYARVYTNSWDIERAISQPVQQRTGIWKEYQEACKKIGLHKTTFFYRMKKGMSPEEASTEPVMTYGERSKWTGRIKPEHVEQAAANGISIGTLKSRVYLYKWDMERAINNPPFQGRKRRRRVEILIAKQSKQRPTQYNQKEAKLT